MDSHQHHLSLWEALWPHGLLHEVLWTREVLTQAMRWQEGTGEAVICSALYTLSLRHEESKGACADQWMLLAGILQLQVHVAHGPYLYSPVGAQHSKN